MAGTNPATTDVNAVHHHRDLLDRGAVLTKFAPPTLDAAFLASLMRRAMAVLMLAALLWLVSGAVRRLQGREGMAAERPPRAPLPIPGTSVVACAGAVPRHSALHSSPTFGMNPN